MPEGEADVDRSLRLAQDKISEQFQDGLRLKAELHNGQIVALFSFIGLFVLVGLCVYLDYQKRSETETCTSDMDEIYAVVKAIMTRRRDNPYGAPWRP